MLFHGIQLPRYGSPLRPGIVHRLDRDTSGVMVIAKTDRAYLELIHMFKNRSVMKFYLALV
ncbi:MAG TPA: RluA family pseudouridine synthase, partial [Candidatus Atribacteria bacterium]|nr:RluA family pseudouridine synthase [Candidatus Atribacteria bacterium]